MRIAIVTVGYNRPKSMQRLIESVISADYDNNQVDLVISIDKGENQDKIVKIAEETQWLHGEKYIRAFEERQGLRAHILQCGALTEKYDAVIVLEDDLIVSPGFYFYCKQMIDYYGEDERISGISLYNNRTDTGGQSKIFDPAEGKADVYFMQVAQSWGQCWTRKMWNNFMNWFTNFQGEIVADELTPAYIASWNSKSWLKYYHRYNSEMQKFFVYPYKSLSTNHMDVGEHATIAVPDYQIPLLNESMEYRCVPLDNGIKYDIFYERMGIQNCIFAELQGKKMLDLMGLRNSFGDADYLFSTQALPYKVIRELKLQYHPLEDNLIRPYDGKGIYVYDLHTMDTPPKNDLNIWIRYYVRGLSWKHALRYGLNGLMDCMKRKLIRK